ncbi:MAG TPA: DUF3303 family protein [Gemmatimonadaceae bacterium]|nr:DUF3303 family protein [Gemmatimonadaceae bacterium]
MIIERFRNGDPVPVYRRFREQGRLAPDGLRYVASWITLDMTLCYQVMETDDPALIADWTERWCDLADFEVIPVRTSAETQELIAEKL